MIIIYSFVSAIKLIADDPKTCSTSGQKFEMSSYALPYVERHLNPITAVIFKFYPNELKILHSNLRKVFCVDSLICY